MAIFLPVSYCAPGLHVLSLIYFLKVLPCIFFLLKGDKNTVGDVVAEGIPFSQLEHDSNAGELISVKEKI